MKVELHTVMWEGGLVDVPHTHLEPLLTQKWLRPRADSSDSDCDDDSVSESKVGSK
jgi:hypothetical protein